MIFIVIHRYELHIPSEFAAHVYEQVTQAGKKLDLVHAGLKALSSLRLEKAYRDFGHDMDNLDTLVEVGLAFTADMNKEGGFVGKEAVQRQQAELKANKGLPRRLVQVRILLEFYVGVDALQRVVVIFLISTL